MQKVVLLSENTAFELECKNNVDWAALEMELAGAAMDAQSGAALIRRLRPDIAIVALENGADLLESLQNDAENTRFVLVSEQVDFESLRRAIHLGVFDYLRAPATAADVTEALSRAAQRRRGPGTAVLEQADRAKRVAQLLGLLTNDRQRGRGVQEQLADVGLNFEAFYVMVVQLQGEQAYSQDILNQIEKAIDGAGVQAETLFLYDALVIFVMCAPDESWHEQAAQIADDIIDGSSMPVRIGISQKGSLHDSFRAVYQQARRALWAIALRKSQEARNFYQDETDAMGDRVTNVHQRIDELIERAELTDESADEAAEVILDLSGQQYSNMRAMVSLYAMALRKKFPCPENVKSGAALDETWFVGNGEDVRTCLRRICAALRSSMEAPEKGWSLLTRNAFAYIQVHAAEGPALNDVAQKLRVSPNYLSALIRRETGITYHEHVRNMRMEMARTLLADPRISIAEVAQAVGYANYISFFNVFKRTENMTPTEYRNQRCRDLGPKI